MPPPAHGPRGYAACSGAAGPGVCIWPWSPAYLLQARLERSRPLLIDPQLNITEIAHVCGFRDANYFIRCYRRYFGKSPGRARLSHFK